MAINVGGWIDSPHISADGRELYFMYAPVDILHFHSTGQIRRGGPDRPGHTTSGDSPEALVNTDLYVARRLDGGGWAVSNLTALNTPDGQECCAFPSWDGRSIYFMRGLPNERPRYWVAQRQGDGFAAPVLANLPVDNGNVALDIAETVMFFDADMADPNAGSGKDIWVTTRTPGGPWAAPTLLPPSVNDPTARSQTPWLSRDGRRLYFHRFLDTGAGSQIFVTEIYNDFQVAELDISGPPYVPALGDRLVAEPSLPEDEQTLYALVYNAEGIAQLWSGQRNTGRWTLQPL